MFNTQPISQRDPQWKDVILGFGDASTTIGSDGCTLTCLTMVANGFGFPETPASLNDQLKALGSGRGFSGALMVFSGLPAALSGITLQSVVLCRDKPAPMSTIDATLDAGRPVMIELDFSPAAGLQNHWVVVYGRQDGDYLIHDPWPVPAESSASLVKRYGFAGTPAQIITAAVFYTGTVASHPDVPPVTAPGPSLVVVVNDNPEIATAGGLAFREAPVSGTVKTRLPAGTELTVQEPIAAALTKVGQMGQWLQVITQGASGFVAAWLVHTKAAEKSIAAARDMLSAGLASPGVADEALIGVVQPPLRRAAPLIVEVLRPRFSLLRLIWEMIKRIVLINAGQSVARSTGAVALRGTPSKRGEVITRLKPGARLTVAEPAASAQQKVGQRSEWLNVYDGDGHEGFVPAASVRVAVVAPTSAQLPPPAAELRNISKALNSDSAATANYPLVQVVDNPDINAAGGLALRDAPITGTVKIRLPAGAQLQVREPAETGLPKVGQLGQWLRVCTSEGVPGYVAAWYVKSIPTPSPQPTPQPAPPGPPVPPEVIAQGVVIASADAPMLSAPQAGASSSWHVSAGTPLRVTESGDWPSKLGQSNQYVQVQSYAFKSGYVQATLLQAPGGLDTRAPVVDAQLPRGVCAWLYGLHDAYERGLFNATGKTGWVLITERVVSGAGNQGYADWANNGYGVIARLNNDYGGSGTIPAPDQYDMFAAQCAQWVKNSAGCNVWIIGNEMNNPREWPESGRNPTKAITPELYANCYNKARAAIKAVQPNAVVLPGAVDPFQGPQMSCLEWFTRMLGAINDLDGFALHCYTNGYTPNLVTDLGCFGDDPLRWQYFHFRAYTTFLDVIPARWRNRPVYITETDAYGTSPWAGGQNGWVQAAYAEINRWNQQPFAQQIHAMILYRWSRDDIYSIMVKPGVQNDIRATTANTDYRWRQ